jgi:hypothetical protein
MVISPLLPIETIAWIFRGVVTKVRYTGPETIVYESVSIASLTFLPVKFGTASKSTYKTARNPNKQT